MRIAIQTAQINVIRNIASLGWISDDYPAVSQTCLSKTVEQQLQWCNLGSISHALSSARLLAVRRFTCIEIINIITIVLLLNSNAETQIMTHGKCETKNIPMGHANAKKLVNCNHAIATNQAISTHHRRWGPCRLGPEVVRQRSLYCWCLCLILLGRMMENNWGMPSLGGWKRK